ncbi:GNAT family N-acetyltransferase [Nocardia sp. NBC_01377]|uniref:GNAT family N-acetyltransferase n=1 Tax=Nocardia sp. NBC_01377 TaxID=2903595 RepID=UPI00325205CE
MVVKLVTEPTQDILTALGGLVSQLSTSAPPLSLVMLEQIVNSPATRLFLAHHDGDVVGALTLVLYAIPTGLRGRIEDVVVDHAMRGRGIGSALTEAAIELARATNVRTLDLTSSPARESANRLYRRLGFAARDSVVYRLQP